MLFRLVLFHLRETLSVRTLVFFLAILLATLFLFSAMPSLIGSADRISFNLSVSIVDPESSLISDALAGILGGMNGMGEVYREDLETARARLDNNEILLILQIPEGFFARSQSFDKRPPVTLYLNPRMPAETAVFVRALRSVADSITGMQAAYMSFAQGIRPLYTDIDTYNKQLGETFSQVAVWALTRRAILTTNETARMSTPLHVISSLVCLLCMQTGLLLIAQAGEERKSGVIYRLALSRAPWWASPLARQLAGLLWAGVSFAPLIVGLKSYYPQARLELLLPAVFCLYWVTASLCQAAGYLSRGGGLALPGAWLVLLVLLLLGGCVYPETLLPAVIKPLMPFSPAYFAYKTVYAGLQGGTLPAGAALAFVWMAAFSAVVLGLAWRHGLQGGRTGVAA